MIASFIFCELFEGTLSTDSYSPAEDIVIPSSSEAEDRITNKSLFKWCFLLEYLSVHFKQIVFGILNKLILSFKYNNCCPLVFLSKYLIKINVITYCAN